MEEVGDGALSGIRVLEQEPLECLLSFICSANNNISRISLMIRRLCSAFGEALVTAAGTFYDFPALPQLSQEPGKVEARLRELGFGYRARYVAQSCRRLAEEDGGGLAWLQRLRSLPCDDARAALVQLPGVGNKVADCVLLMALRQSDVVPVDVHVAAITRAHFLPTLPTGNLTPSQHSAIRAVWRSRFGHYAGWAQAVLFSAQLKRFASVKLPKQPKNNAKMRQKS